MLHFIIIIVLALLVFSFVLLQKTYANIPRKELKRRAKAGDELASLLYRAAAYELNLTIMLWSFIGLSASGLFLALVSWLPPVWAFILVLAFLWSAFAWLPNTEVGKVSLLLARWLTPPIAWLLNNFSPGLSKISRIVNKRVRISHHTGIYEREDLLELINRQKKETNNRIDQEELDIVAHVLTFGNKVVREIMVPRRVVKAVSASETIGPVLMDELHKNGHSRFPVYQGKQDNIVGTLYVRDLVEAKDGGTVSAVMRRDVYYVNEELLLGHVLDAFLKTKHHLFIVVNNFEEMVGIITIEDVLEQIIGKPIMDEFDQYEDLRAVATIQAEKDLQEHENSQEVIE